MARTDTTLTEKTNKERQLLVTGSESARVMTRLKYRHQRDGLTGRFRSQAEPGKVAHESLKTDTEVLATILEHLPDERVELEREGVPSNLLAETAQELGWTKVELYEAIGIPKATADARLRTGDLVTGAPAFALLNIVALLQQGQEIVRHSTHTAAEGFCASQWLGQWLKTPQPALNGKTPKDYLDTPTGHQIVERLLHALESGAYQ